MYVIKIIVFPTTECVFDISDQCNWKINEPPSNKFPRRIPKCPAIVEKLSQQIRTHPQQPKKQKKNASAH